MNKIRKKSIYRAQIKGKISVASYSTLSNTRDNLHRVMSRFSLYADNISNTPVSFESYITYRQYLNSGEQSSNYKNNYFNVYDLALKYNIEHTLTITAGRKINSKISSVGAIDGLQIEKYIGNNYIGVIGGFKPDFFNFGFNSNLFEYGAYIGNQIDRQNFNSQSTLGFIEQQNSGNIDRRYVYFQHSSTLFKKINLFSSLELDTYNKVKNLSNKAIRLTNLYVSARYRFNRQLNVSMSFDSRKQILYYETFQSNIEKLLDDDLTRKGIRLRINTRPKNNIYAGISYSKRYQNDNKNKSDNIYTFLTISNLPGITGSINVNYNVNKSNYLESDILTLRHSRYLIHDKLFADFYYRFVNYTYTNGNSGLSNPTPVQSYYGADLSYNIGRRLTLSVSGEYSKSGIENNYRIYTKLIKRFYTKRKKNYDYKN
jgi:hypothetical protein